VGQTSGCRISFADKYFETGGVTMTYFGDGAARQGSLKLLIWLCYGNFRLFYCGEQWLRDGNISRKNG
jgi:hypothetical protein